MREACSWKEKWRFQEGPDEELRRGADVEERVRKMGESLGLKARSDTILGWLSEGYGPSKGDGFTSLDLRGVKGSMEVFSGSGHWSRSLARRGFDTWEFDYCNDGHDDILNPHRFLDLAEGILSGKYSALHFGTPCRSWSKARSPKLRAEKWLYHGVPGLRPHELQIIREGNELLRRSLVLLRLACCCGLAVTLENPFSSLLWEHVEVKKWIREFGIECIETHYCQWGAPWMKPTKLAANYKQIRQLARRCQGGQTHVILKGKTAEGVFRTSLAASYPEALCDAWAVCVESAITCMKSSAEDNVIKELEGDDCNIRPWDPVIPVEWGVPPIPDSMLKLEDYTLLYNHAWRAPEAIHSLEARAALKGVFHACRTPACRSTRVLFLTDNMAVALAFAKGGCRNFGLLKHCRRLAASVLAYRICPCFRYVETARNVADGPTRPYKASEAPRVPAHHEAVRVILPPPGLEPRRLEDGGRHM